MGQDIKKLRDMVCNIYENSTQLKYWEHTKRVFVYAKSIGKKEGAMMEILLPAVLLHDIGVTEDPSYDGHIKKSMKMSKKILEGLGYSIGNIDKIVHVVGSHNVEPGAMLDSLEEQILYDADCMEIVGVFGVLRWIGTLPVKANDLHSSIDLFLEIYEKSIKSRGSLFFTNSARKIGDAALKSSIAYFKKLKHHIEQFDDGLDSPIPIAL